MKTLVLILAGLLLTACGDRTPLQFSVKEDLPVNSEVNFGSVKKFILRTKCVSCHRHYETYEGVKADLEKILTAVESDRMPKNASPLSPEQKEFLKKWVSLGAPNGDTDQTVEAGVLVKILGPKCIQCHNPGGEAKFLELSTRQAIWKERAKLFNFDDPGSSYFLEVITDPVEPMPPIWSGLPRLSDEEVEVLKKWIGDGIP